MTARILPSLLLLLAALAGCRSDPAGTAEPTVIWRKPGTGSIFTYDILRIDTNGARIENSRGTYPDKVLSSDTTLYGVTGQLLIDHIGFDELLYDYRSDADLAIAFVGRGGIRYPQVVYPVATRTPKTHPQETVAGVFPPLVRGSTTSYLGSDSLTTHAGRFLTHRILFAANDTTTDGIAFTTADTIWFAPSLGTYVQKSYPPYPIANREGLQVFLKSYVLR